MGVVQLRQIKNYIEGRYAELIDMSDYNSRPEQDRKNALLSRSLAAFALSIDNEIDAKAASGSIVDGYDDNGIDAIYYSVRDKTLHLCQAKWSADGTSTIDQGSVEKFIRGSQDFLNVRFERFNSKVKKRKIRA